MRLTANDPVPVRAPADPEGWFFSFYRRNSSSLSFDLSIFRLSIALGGIACALMVILIPCVRCVMRQVLLYYSLHHRECNFARARLRAYGS